MVTVAAVNLVTRENLSEEQTLPIYRAAQPIASAMSKSPHSWEILPITASVQLALALMVATRVNLQPECPFLYSLLSGSFSGAPSAA